MIINHPLSATSIYYDPWHPLCSIYVPASLFLQSPSFLWSTSCLQCFNTVGWAAGRAASLLKLSVGILVSFICLGRGADLHMAQLMPLPLKSHYLLLQ